MKRKTLRHLISMLAILCLLLCACVPDPHVFGTDQTNKETELTTPPSAESESTESTEVPTESTEAPTESTEEDLDTEEPKQRYTFVDGTRAVNQLVTRYFYVDMDAKEILFSCLADYGKTKHRVAYDSLHEETDITFCYRERVHVTPCDDHGDVKLTYFIEYYGSYELVIPCHGNLKKEITFTCEGKDYVLPYYRSSITNGFVWDIYEIDGGPRVKLCRQTSAFLVDLGSNAILRRPDEITDWDSLIAWATAFAVETVAGFSPDTYDFYVAEQNLEKLDLSLAKCEDDSIISFGYELHVGGVNTNELVRISLNTRGDIVGIYNGIHGADWSTVTPEILKKYGSWGGDTTFTVTAQGIKVYYTEWPGGNLEGIAKVIEP